MLREFNRAFDISLEDIFYTYMASAKHTTFNGERVSGTDRNLTGVDLLYKETVDTLAEVEDRIHEIEVFKKEYNDTQLDSLLEALKEERKHLKNSSMSYMKKLYKETGIVDFSRSIVEIPIGESISPYRVVINYSFYDDLGVLKGKYNKYKKLKGKSERLRMIRNYTEITHINIITYKYNTPYSIIRVKGNLNTDDLKKREVAIYELERSYR